MFSRYRIDEIFTKNEVGTNGLQVERVAGKTLPAGFLEERAVCRRDIVNFRVKIHETDKRFTTNNFFQHDSLTPPLSDPSLPGNYSKLIWKLYSHHHHLFHSVEWKKCILILMKILIHLTTRKKRSYYIFFVNKVSNKLKKFKNTILHYL